MRSTGCGRSSRRAYEAARALTMPDRALDSATTNRSSSSACRISSRHGASAGTAGRPAAAADVRFHRHPARHVVSAGPDDPGPGRAALHRLRRRHVPRRGDQPATIRSACSIARARMPPSMCGSADVVASRYSCLAGAVPAVEDAAARGRWPGCDAARRRRSQARWRLIVQHQSGSLEAAVGSDSPSQPRHQLRHPAAPDLCGGDADGHVAAR